MADRALERFLASLPARHRRQVERLESPPAIQRFLDRIPYSTEPVYRSPRSVLRDRRAHCFDGAMFAAMALRRIGHPPLLTDMLADNDDDHVLALFRAGGAWGCVAKSNFVGLRYREPVYRTVRELVMSYFEAYYNTARQKTLRGHTRPLRLRRLDGIDWMGSDARLDDVANALDAAGRIDLVTAAQARALQPVDPLAYRAGLLGADRRGLYRPG